jgi:putative peptidoglycan lipid II flippase
MDSQVSIFSSAKLFSGTILSRFSGLLRDVVMASAFGTHEAVAAFMAAFRFAHLLRRIFGEGCLQTAFIPQFEEIRGENPQNAYRFFRDLSVALSVVLLIIIGFSLLGISAFLSFLTLNDSSVEVAWLTFLMMPSLIFICLYGLNTGFLQCERSYFIGSVAPVAFNVIWVIATLCLWGQPVGFAMKGLSIAIILGSIAQWMMTLPPTLSTLKRNLGQSFWRELKIDLPPLKKLLTRFLLSLIGVGAMQVNSALDALFARYAESSGPAYLWYAIRIEQLPLALFGIALSGALLPPLSRAMKASDLYRFKLFLEFAIRRTIGFLFPITIAIFILGCASVNLLYGRGLFDQESVLGTTWCLWGYGIGLLPSTLILILAPAFYAQGNYKLPTIASLASMILNVFLNIFLVAYLNLGAASIALATSISAFANVLILAVPLTQKIGSIVTSQFIYQILKTVTASIIGVIFCFAAEYYFFNQITILQIFSGGMISLPQSFIDQLVALLVPAISFGSSLFLAGWAINAEDIGIKIKGLEVRSD